MAENFLHQHRTRLSNVGLDFNDDMFNLALNDLHPIHTIPGYSRWILTQVIKLGPALLHTTDKTVGPARSCASFQEYKISAQCIINICYLVRDAKIEATKSSKAKSNKTK